jgi:hypothetical protein
MRGEWPALDARYFRLGVGAIDTRLAWSYQEARLFSHAIEGTNSGFRVLNKGKEVKV